MQAGRLEDTEKTGDEEAQRHRDTEIQLFKFSESPLRLVSVTHRPRLFLCLRPLCGSTGATAPGFPGRTSGQED